MSLQDLGQLVKQKHPGAYDNIPDEQLGQQVYTKYPQYKNIVEQGQQPAKSPVQPGGFLETILQPIMNALGATKAGGTLREGQAGQTEEQQRLQASSETAKNREIGGAAEIAALTTGAPELKAGSKFLQGLLPGAARGVAYATGKGVEQKKSFVDTLKSMPLNAASFALLEGTLNEAVPAIADLFRSGGNALSRASELADVPKGVQKANFAKDTFNKMLEYGATTLEKAKSMAERVTGANGIISKITRAAVGKSEPVDTSGVMDLVQQELGLANRPTKNEFSALGTQERKLYQKVLSGITQAMGRGTPEGPAQAANPSELFGLVQDLEARSAELSKSFRRSGNQDVGDMAGSYKRVADELKDRLYSSADQILTSGVKEPFANELKAISPKLHDAVMATNTVGELRSLAAPFVKAGIMHDAVGELGQVSKGGLDVSSILPAVTGKGSLANIVLGVVNDLLIKGSGGAMRGTGKAIEVVDKFGGGAITKTLSRLGLGKLINRGQ